MQIWLGDSFGVLHRPVTDSFSHFSPSQAHVLAHSLSGLLLQGLRLSCVVLSSGHLLLSALSQASSVCNPFSGLSYGPEEAYLPGLAV